MIFQILKNCLKFGKKFHFREFLFFLCMLLTFSGPVMGQMEELKQTANAFYQSNATHFDRKLYNLSSRDHGKIKETEPTGIFEMQLTHKERDLNTGRKMRVYLTLYQYRDEDDCRMASEFWFKRFIGGASIRPNKKTKLPSVESSYFILLNSGYIAILDVSCLEWEKEKWEMIKKSFLHIFEEKKSKALEIDCTGTLHWSLNPF